MSTVQLSLSSTDGDLLQINEKTVSRALNSYLCSAKYLRHIVPLTMFYIINNRVEYDPKHYLETNIKDWHYVILDKDNQHSELNNLYLWSYGAMEALEKGCLSQLFLKIHNNNEMLEYYRYSFQYCKNPPTVRPEGTSNEILKITRDWFQNFSILKSITKIPCSATLSMEVVLLEHPERLTLLHYKEVTNSEVYDKDKNDCLKNLMHLGGINTKYHKVQAYCKIKSIETSAASLVGDNEVIEILDDDLNEPTNTVEKSSVKTSEMPSKSKDINNQIAENDDLLNKTKINTKGALIKKKSRKSQKDAAISTEVPKFKILAEKIISCKNAENLENQTTIFENTTVTAVETEIPSILAEPSRNMNKNDEGKANLPKKSKKKIEISKLNAHTETDNKVKENVQENITNVPILDSVDQKVLKSKIKRAKQDKVKFFENITVDLLEPENPIQSNLESEKATKSRKKTKSTKNNAHTEKDNKVKENTEEQDSNITNAPILDLEDQKVLKSKIKRAKKGTVEIVENMTVELVEAEIPVESYLNSETSEIPSELYINNESVLKGKRKLTETTTRQDLAKTQSIDKQKSRQDEISTKLNDLPRLELEKNTVINESIFEDTTLEMEVEALNPNPIELVVNEETKRKELASNTGLYINEIRSLTPKKTKTKRKIAKNSESDLNAPRKSRKKLCLEKQSFNLSRHQSTQSFDSMTLGGSSKKSFAVIRQPLIDSTQLAANSIELGGDKLNAEETQSVSSTEEDMAYIINRIQF